MDHDDDKIRQQWVQGILHGPQPRRVSLSDILQDKRNIGHSTPDKERTDQAARSAMDIVNRQQPGHGGRD